MFQRSRRGSAFFLFLAVFSLNFFFFPGFAEDKPVTDKGAASSDEVLVTVGEKKILRSEFDKEFGKFRENANPNVKAQFDTPEGKKQFLEQMVDVSLLEQQAAKDGLAEKPENKKSVDEMTIGMLSGAYIQGILEKITCDDKDIEKFYEANKTQFTTPEKYHLHQITFEKEEDAAKARKDIEGGKSFQEIAKASSTDNFKSSGGDRGFIPGTEISPEVAGVVADLKENQISAPIKSGEGKFLVVKYSEKQAGTLKPLADVSAQIKRELGEERQKDEYKKRMGELEKEFGLKMEKFDLQVLTKPEFSPADLEQAICAIGTETIKLAALLPELERIPAIIRPMVLQGEGLNDFLNQFCHRELVKRYVQKNFQEVSKQFPDAINEAKRRVSIRVLLDENVGKKVEVSDAELQEFYTKNLPQFSRPAQVRASHILVKEEAKAKELLEKITSKKATFEDLAKSDSTCPSGKKGGDLGFFEKGAMVPEFDEVAQAAELGKIMGPVKTQFGFHLIRVDERRASGTVPLEDVKDKIRQQLLPDKHKAAFEKYLGDLKKVFPVKETEAKL